MTTHINPWHIVRLAPDSTVYVTETGNVHESTEEAVEYFTCYNVEYVPLYGRQYLQAYTGEAFVFARREDVSEVIEPALPPSPTTPLDRTSGEHKRSHDTARDCADDFVFTSDEVEAGGDGDLIEPLTCDYCGRSLEFFFQFRGLWNPGKDEYVFER